MMSVLIIKEPETLMSETSRYQSSTMDEQGDVGAEGSPNALALAVVQENPEQVEQRLLVGRALRGEQEAFNDIVAQYSAMMLRTASMIVGDRDTAEDVVQDALIQVWHHLPELREAGALRSWLMRIVVNQCISFKRKVTRSTAFVRQSLLDHETDMLAQIADDHKGRMERDWDIASAIGKLPAKQRVVIVLHYYYGMTLPEMAQTMHISENTLKKRIQAALANLRRNLYRNEHQEDESNAVFCFSGTKQRFAISLS